MLTLQIFRSFIRRRNCFIVWISIVLLTLEVQQTNGEANKNCKLHELSQASYLAFVSCFYRHFWLLFGHVCCLFVFFCPLAIICLFSCHFQASSLVICSFLAFGNFLFIFLPFSVFGFLGIFNFLAI